MPMLSVMLAWGIITVMASLPMMSVMLVWDTSEVMASLLVISASFGEAAGPQFKLPV